MIAEQRRQRNVRDMAEMVLRRAELLDTADRALLEQVLGRGVAPRDVAAVKGVSTRTVQRRVRALTRRLTDPQVLHVMRHRGQWEKLTAEVATAVWIRRWTLRRTAKELGVSLHRVRQRVEAVKGVLMCDV